MPLILRAFERANVKALFFVSTEILHKHSSLIVKSIEEHGHEVGSHGHFHTPYKEDFRKEIDRQISLQFLSIYQSLPKEAIKYRGPKFSYKVNGDVYSDRKGHTGLLRHMWLGEPVKNIIYIHPFDIVGGNDAPNLFCKLWYSRPSKAYETFTNLLERYPGHHRLKTRISKAG